MKEVVYSDKKVYLLTNKEFAEAMALWNQKKNYWCQRIEKLLPPFILHAGTPDREVGRKIYLLPLMDGNKIVKLREVFKDENENYYEVLDSSGKIMSVSDFEIENKELVLQEDYYNNKNKLIEALNSKKCLTKK
jgi:hypothetical protein